MHKINYDSYKSGINCHQPVFAPHDTTDAAAKLNTSVTFWSTSLSLCQSVSNFIYTSTHPGPLCRSTPTSVFLALVGDVGLLFIDEEEILQLSIRYIG